MHPNKIAFISEVFNAGVIPALKEKFVRQCGERLPFAVIRGGSRISAPVAHCMMSGDIAILSEEAGDIQAWVDSLPDGSNIVIPDYCCGQQVGEFVWEVQYCRNGVLPLAYFGGKHGNVGTDGLHPDGRYAFKWIEPYP